jgi:hypothetical protein
MIRWITLRTLAALLIGLSMLTASCRQSEKDVTGCWAGKVVVLVISCEGENGEKVINGEPMFAALTYRHGRLIWRGEELRRVAAEAYARAAPEL